jgi:flagellar assembly factor FliW
MSIEVDVTTERDEQIAQTEPVLSFLEAPLGLSGLQTFRMRMLDEYGYLYSLRSVEAPSVRLFAVAPEAYFPDYAPTLSAESLAPLELGEAEPATLVVVRPGEGDEAPTANLLAPIALNPTTGAALQIVLDSDEWPLRAPFTVVA